MIIILKRIAIDVFGAPSEIFIRRFRTICDLKYSVDGNRKKLTQRPKHKKFALRNKKKNKN